MYGLGNCPGDLNCPGNIQDPFQNGLGDGPPLGPGMKDCGGGSSVRADLACPVLTPLDPALVAAGQAQWQARRDRCLVYTNKEHGIDTAVALAAAFLLPGAWKLLAIPLWVATDIWYPRSDDCDYGF